LVFVAALKSVHDTFSTSGRGHRLCSAWHRAGLPSARCRVPTAAPVQARPRAWAPALPATAAFHHALARSSHRRRCRCRVLAACPRPALTLAGLVAGPRAAARAVVAAPGTPRTHTHAPLPGPASGHHHPHRCGRAWPSVSHRTRTSCLAGLAPPPPSRLATVRSHCASTTAAAQLLLWLTFIAASVSLPAYLCHHV